MPEPTTILVVDDSELNRENIKRRLELDGYSVMEADGGPAALQVLAGAAIDLVLLDYMMPQMDGYAVLTEIKKQQELQHIPVVMISAQDEQDSVIRCLEAGADDYLSKPVNTVLMRARINSCLAKKRLWDKERHYQKKLEYLNHRLKDKVHQQLEQISSAQLATIFATSKLAESKDPETGSHLERLREFCRVLAQELMRGEYYRLIDSNFISCIYAASPLHDIGKVGIPDQILLKPGKLNDNEWEIMRTHPIIGAETLRAVAAKHPGNDFIEMGINIAEGHHEKWDGSGYPYGLSGEAIPLEARILALTDVYDALTSVRCYKPAFSHEKSRAIIVEGGGAHFDPAVVKAFLNVEDEFIRIRREYRDSEEQAAPSLQKVKL